MRAHKSYVHLTRAGLGILTITNLEVDQIPILNLNINLPELCHCNYANTLVCQVFNDALVGMLGVGGCVCGEVMISGQTGAHAWH